LLEGFSRSALPDPIAGFKVPPSKGKEGRKNGKEGQKGKRGREEEVKEREDRGKRSSEFPSSQIATTPLLV